MGTRYDATRALLGENVFAQVQNARILVVGAGGIGCELIKNLVMTGFGTGKTGEIQVLDLDTIDLSNLNRQFLFQMQHVTRPKAVVARETALKFNPDAHIVALHRNIKDTDFDVAYFSSFDLVLNALDNLDARRHVNKMCLAVDVPLVESGTSGYFGQVQPIKKDLSECFDCSSKPVPKTFAVCTIRSTPSTAHHCIAWAKSYLLPALFGDDDDSNELDQAEKNGENADELKELRKEAEAMRDLRKSLKEADVASRIFEKVYQRDIERLLQMEDMWKHRSPPHKLDLEAIKSIEKTTHATGLKDQQSLSLRDSYELFVSSVDRLCARISDGITIVFDKDDADTLDFVTACANLRASAFGIESQTRFQVKEYAGNIIPAIATTNAIIAGVLVFQALNIIRGTWDQSRFVFLSRVSNKTFSCGKLSPPNPQCSICQIVYCTISFIENTTLGNFVKELINGKLGFEFASIQEGSRILWETEDFEDNNEKTLADLGVKAGITLTVIDGDEPHFPISFSFINENASTVCEETEHFKLYKKLPSEIPLKQAPEQSDEEVVESNTNRKRTADEAGLSNQDSSDKRSKTEDILLIDDDDALVIID